MARERQQTLPEDRRRRVQRLKKMIIGIVAVGMVIPILCCVYLICRLHTINGTLRTLEQRLEELDARNRERQTLLQQLESEDCNTARCPNTGGSNSGEVSEQRPESEPGQEMIHKVYLTFDDGPSIYTNDILDILDSYNVKATFFVVGKEGSEAEAALQRIVDEGHTLWECIHTVINIRNCTNQWIVLHRILHGSGTPSIRLPEWRASVTGSRVEAPIRSARSICMILSSIWTVREWNIMTGMCPPETVEA